MNADRAERYADAVRPFTSDEDEEPATRAAMAVADAEQAELQAERDEWQARHARAQAEVERLDAVMAHVDEQDASEGIIEATKDAATLRAERDEWRARHARQRETYRELFFDGMSVADWHRKHCDALFTIERVREMAKIRAISCRALGKADAERDWLDVLAIVDGGDR